MKVGIIGSGVVGQQLGFGFLRLGHEVKIGTRDTTKLNNWLKQAGKKASVGSFEDAAKFGELNVIATAWAGTESAINLAGRRNFSSKIVVDVTNPLDFSNGFPPKFAVNVGNSAGEQIQRMLPEAKVVKAFNIINAYVMINPQREDGDPDLFIAGNDQTAKDKVKSIAEHWGWKSVIDIGDISQSLFLEALTQIWIGYAAKTNKFEHAFKLLKK